MHVPARIVVGARAHADLIARWKAARPGLEFRGAPHPQVTADDLAWGDTYIGFRRPPVATWGSIRWVHCTGAGVDAFTWQDALPRDILLTRTSESFGPMIAEYCLAHALAERQHVREFTVQQAERRWQQCDVPLIAGARVVVLGTGDVGTAVAKLLTAVGCRVEGISRTATPRAPFHTIHPTSALAQVVPGADIFVLAAPLTPATNRLVDRTVLAACRETLLINVGRGAVVDDGALREALDSGALRGAVLDVFETEPLPADAWQWSHPKVRVTPHISGLTTIDGAVESFLECLDALEHQRLPATVVDRDRGY